MGLGKIAALGYVAAALVLAVLGCERLPSSLDNVSGGNEPRKTVVGGDTMQTLLNGIAKARGFNGPVIDLDSFVVVEGCYHFAKSEFLRTPLSKSAQRRASYLVDQTAIRQVRVKIDGSIPQNGSNDYWIAVQSAINAWNSVLPTSAQFIYTTGSTYDILVRSDFGALIGTGYAADAELPFDHKAGKLLRINLTEYGGVSQATKTAVVTHELGHTIGLEHTNQTAGVHIAGTPSSEANSIMNSSVGPSSLITGWDALALAALYPDYERLGGAWWDQAVDMTSLGAYLYIIHASKLYRVDPGTGSFTQLGGTWWNQAVAIAAYGSYLYIIHASKLYKVDPNTGNYTQLGGTWWNQAVDMTSLGSYLYIIHGSNLYRVDPSNGSYLQLGGSSWNQAVAISAVNSSLYIIHGGTLYQVDPSSGSYASQGSAVYQVAPIKMTNNNGFLYIVENSALNRTQTDGAYLHGQDAIWTTTRAMAALGDFIFIIQGSYLTKVRKLEL